VSILLAAGLLILQGCASVDNEYLTPASAETLSAHTPSTPIETKLEAVIAARLMIRDGRRVESETPQVVYVGKSSLNEAMNILYNTAGVEYEKGPNEDKVWLVIFRGTWLIFGPPSPDGMSESTLRAGCAHALFTAAERRLISSGGSQCPPPDQMPP
jgi:hypothetical protein